MFALPETLAARGYALRPETDADENFLHRLYASTRAAELASVPWNQAQKDAFVAQQFAAQRHHYRTRIGDCACHVIVRGDEPIGEPIGRLYLQRRAANLHVVDISLVPEARGGGLGTLLLTMVIDAARAAGCGVGLFVERTNPALALYLRLGFVKVADHGMHLEMERPLATISRAAGATRPTDQLNTAS